MTVVRPAREEDVEAAAEMLNEHSRSTARHRRHDRRRPAPVLDVPGRRARPRRPARREPGRPARRLRATSGVHGDAVWLDVRGTDPATLPVMLEAIEQRATTKEPDKKLWGYTLRRRRPARRAVRADGLPQGAPLVPHADRPRRRSAPSPKWPDGVSVRTMREARSAGSTTRRWRPSRTRGCSLPTRTTAGCTGWSRSASFDPFPVVHRRSRTASSRASSSRERPRMSPASAGCASWASCPSTANAAWGKRCSGTRSPSLRGVASRAVGLGVDAENPTGAVRCLRSGPGCTSSGRDLMFEKLEG